MGGFRIKRGRLTGGGVPLVAPAAGWDGTITWGGRTPPTDPTRTTAKPAAQFRTPSAQAMVGTNRIGLRCGAKGGIAYVDYWVEGTVQRVTESVVSWTDARGYVRPRIGHWIDFDGLNAATRHQGTVEVWAEVVANDGTMQHRVIGPLTIYPRLAASDHAEFPIGPSQTYTTIKLAMEAANAAGSVRPIFRIMETGNYEVEDSVTPVVTSEGFPLLTHANGVTAVLRRTATPTYSTFHASQQWRPLYSGLEIRGAGIRLDIGNFRYILSGGGATPRPMYFHGCEFFDSLGSFTSSHWNNGPAEPFNQGDWSGNSTVATVWYEDIYANDVSINFVDWAQGIRLKNGGGRPFYMTHFVSDVFVQDTDITYWSAGFAGLSFHYTGANATATVTMDGAGGLTLTDSSAHSITLGNLPGDTYYAIATIVTWANGLTGWTCTNLDAVGNAKMRASFLNSGYAVGPSDAKGATVTLRLYDDVHCEYYQNHVAIANLVFTENIGRRNKFDTALIHSEAAADDSYIVNNALGTTVAYDGQIDNGFGGSHNVMQHNYIPGTWGVYGGNDAYAEWGCNAADSFGLGQFAGSWDAVRSVHDQYAGHLLSTPVGSNYTNIIDLTTAATMRALMTDYAGGDFRPLAGSRMLTTDLVPKTVDFDLCGTARSASDCIGPVSKNTVAMISYPPELG